MLKRILIVAVAVLVLPLAILAIGGGGQAAPEAQAQTATPAPQPVLNPARTITVVGQGSSRVMPDVASVTVGVETMADTVADATQENQVKMRAILAALKQLGILDKDVQTSNYSISLNRLPTPQPLAEGEAAQQETEKYTVSNMVTVTIRDLDLVSEVLDAVVEAGANSVWGVNFAVDKPETMLEEARARAVADARARAEALADLGGVTLGSVMSMSEVVGQSSVGLPMYDMAVSQAAGGSTPISPGEIELSYQLQVTYFISDAD
jgi:hypothetical protein